MSEKLATIDEHLLARLQSHAVRQINGHTRSDHFFVDHSEPAKVRELLRLLNGEKLLLSASETRRLTEEDPPPSVVVGFTNDALRTLGITYRPLLVDADNDRRPADDRPQVAAASGERPREMTERGAVYRDPFSQGMLDRRHWLGDPETSDWPGNDKGVLVWVSSADDEARKTVTKVLERLVSRDGFHLERGEWPATGSQPKDKPAKQQHLLGYRDGTSNPYVAEIHRNSRRLRGGGTPLPNGRWEPVPLGELVLGYPDAGGDHQAPGPTWLTHDGTHLVYRKYRVDEDGFEAFLSNAVDEAKLMTGDEVGGPTICAKLMGRYQVATNPNGAASLLDSVIPVSDSDGTGEVERANDFRYELDTAGYQCPLGAHIRRANPRDGFGFHGDLVARHRLMRRGSLQRENDGTHLHFVATNARIADGFEMIQTQWLNHGHSFRLGSSPDPFVGARTPGKPVSFVVQGERPYTVTSDEPISELIGGAYFLIPGLAGIERLAAEPGEGGAEASS